MTALLTFVMHTQGAEAFYRGEVRIVPRDILVNQGVDAAREWYQGWDAANLADTLLEPDLDRNKPWFADHPYWEGEGA